MKARYIFAVALSITYAAMPSSVTAHPTNGHLCTEIQNPIRCFESDGFCEWISTACLYRCDLHDTAPDCEEIKDGCAWDGRHCIQIPSSLDAGTAPQDVGVSNERDAATGLADSAPVDMSQITDSTGLPGDAAPPLNHRDSSILSIDATDSAQHQPRSPHQGCTAGYGAPLTGYVLVCILMFLWRRS